MKDDLDKSFDKNINDMNTATHFLTGVLVSRVVFKKENDHFLSFFAGMAAILPDLDIFLHLIFPGELFNHAVFTHTLIGVLILISIYTPIVWLIGKKFLKNLNVSFKILFLIAFSSVFSHLIVDIFTYREDVLTSNAHLYFWPLSDFSFHLNGFFHQSIYPNIHTVRLLIEIFYSIILTLYLMRSRDTFKIENLFHIFSANLWLNYVEPANTRDNFKGPARSLLIFNFALLSLMIVGMVFYYII